MSEAATLLADAVGVVKFRGEQYGQIYDNFQRIAHLWDSLSPEMSLYKPHDVAMYMICVKLSRLVDTPGHRDNWLDIAGYAACGWECAVAEEKKK